MAKSNGSGGGGVTRPTGQGSGPKAGSKVGRGGGTSPVVRTGGKLTPVARNASGKVQK